MQGFKQEFWVDTIRQVEEIIVGADMFRFEYRVEKPSKLGSWHIVVYTDRFIGAAQAAADGS